MGARWKEDHITYNIADILHDLDAKRSRHTMTLDVLKTAANQTLPFLKFTGEVATDSQGIPVMDTRVGVGACKGGTPRYPGGPVHGCGEGTGLVYSFYSKSMANPGMLQRSAISEQSKKSTAINEILRRFKNFSLEIEQSRVESV